jgi:hypothetical protein
MGLGIIRHAKNSRRKLHRTRCTLLGKPFYNLFKTVNFIKTYIYESNFDEKCTFCTFFTHGLKLSPFYGNLLRYVTKRWWKIGFEMFYHDYLNISLK